MSSENMRLLVQKHIEMETMMDLEGVLATLVDHPVYEFHPARLRLEGKENVRVFYREHFDSFFPLIQSSAQIHACWDTHSACLEFDLYLKPPHDRDRPYRIMVSLKEQDSLLTGERFYVENELARLMAGASFSRFTKF
jgi:hypothetical protein